MLRHFSKKKVVGVFIMGLVLAFSFCLSMPSSTYAKQKSEGGTVQTLFFGPLKDDMKGCGMFTVVNFAVEIITFGVIVAAAIGLTMSGITYLTAKGDDSKAIKGKKRMADIVIGLGIYAVIWVGVEFLLPGGLMNTSCQVGEESDSLWTEPKNKSTKGGASLVEGLKNTDGDSSSSSGSNSVLDAASKIAKKLQNTKSKDKKKLKYIKGKAISNWPDVLNQGGTDDKGYVSLVAQKVGMLKVKKIINVDGGKIVGQENLVKGKYQIIKTNDATAPTLVKNGLLKPGDIVGPAKKEPKGISTKHIMIFKSCGKNKCYYYSANSKKDKKSFKASSMSKRSYSTKYKIGVIIRPV